MSQSNSQLYLSPNQQDLLLAALNSNQPNAQSGRKPAAARNSVPNNMASADLFDSMAKDDPGSGQLNFGVDESPYLDFDGDFDDSYNFDMNGQQMIGDLPDITDATRTSSPDEESDLHDKRKDTDDKDNDDEGGGKRRESDDKAAKKPGRKPLTSEPTSKRKAQNRAAQRAFRDRKEKHLKDLETKVDDLQKASDAANNENSLLKAQVERLQVELKEYRKRLSWVSNSSLAPSRATPVTAATNNVGNNNDFHFEFPKFGDLPGAAFNSNGTLAKTGPSNASSNKAPNRSTSLPNPAQRKTNSTDSVSKVSPRSSVPTAKSGTDSPAQQHGPVNAQSASPPSNGSPYDSFSGLFSPSILEASRNFEYFPQTGANQNQSSRGGGEGTAVANGQQTSLFSNSTVSNSNSPSVSSDSQRLGSSIGTSPEPSLSSPSGTKANDFGLNTINEEGPGARNANFESNAFGNDLLSGNDFGWLAQQNGGSFDPVLFGDYRESQDAVVNQDFGSFFNEAFPLPDLGSPLHNFNDLNSPQNVPPKTDLMKQVDAAQGGDDVERDAEGRSKLMTCNKIWDKLQSMEKFRNGEIDVDNLCSELRAKARCSEGGAVVDEKDVNTILKSAQR